MNYFNSICTLCLSSIKDFRQLCGLDGEELSYYWKLTVSIPEMQFEEMNDQKLICGECCVNVDTIYKFREKCLRSKTILLDYIAQLNSVNHQSVHFNTHPTIIAPVKGSVQMDSDNVNNSKNIGPWSGNIGIGTTLSVVNQEMHLNTKLNYEKHEDKVRENFEFVFKNPEEIKTEIDIEEDPLATSDENICNIKIETVEHEIDIKPSQIQEKIVENKNTEGSGTNIIYKPTWQVDKSLNKEKRLGIKPNIGKYKKLDPVHTIETPYRCYICKKYFSRKRILDIHMRKHTGERPYECNICNKKFSQSSNLTTHMRTHSAEKPYECTICDNKFSQLSILQAHMRKHTGEKPYECTMCPKRFSQQSNLTSHLRTHTQEKSYQCFICNRTFNLATNLETHMRIHTGEKPFECEICKKTFAQSNNLTTHLQTHFKEKLYECNICQKKFNLGSNLETHMRKHTGEEKSFECNICNKKFSQSNNLTIHQRTHTGEKPFECEICNKKFTQSSNLTTHMRIHTGIKPYDCTICGKKFNHASILDTHMRIHTNEKPFECIVCNKKFSQSSNLTAHLGTHPAVNSV